MSRINPESFPDFTVTEEFGDAGPDQILRFNHVSEDEYLTIDAFKIRDEQYSVLNWRSRFTKDEALRVFRDLVDVPEIGPSLNEVRVGPCEGGINLKTVATTSEYKAAFDDSDFFEDTFLVRVDVAAQNRALAWESGQLPELGPGGFGIISHRLLDEDWHHDIFERTASEQSKLLVAEYSGKLVTATSYFFERPPSFPSLLTSYAS